MNNFSKRREDEKRPAGLEFLQEEVTEQKVFTPECFTAEQKTMAMIAQDFLTRELLPRTERIEQAESGLMRNLMIKAGESGLMMADVPKEYGGSGTGLRMSTILSEQIAWEHSFAATWIVQTGISLLPLVYFGSEALKAKYLPGMVTGKIIGAFAVTEAEAGSDIMATRTRAALSADGRYYILNGAKKWISNAGLADIFIVFAKVDDTKFTEFVIEKKWVGVSIGSEEQKLGIRGSSHCPVFFEDVRVPVENVLGEIGKGSKIVFSTLALGRLKMAAGCAGACKEALALTIKHTAERRTFGKPLGDFGLIQKKLAWMAAETYVIESMVYRSIGAIDDRLTDLRLGNKLNRDQIQAAIDAYAIEASICKIFASEASGRIIDEGLQLFGGYGYIQGHAIERAYRDIRITRIYEGTNEINRLLIAEALLRQQMPTMLKSLPQIEEIIKNERSRVMTGPIELREPLSVLKRAKLISRSIMTKATISLLPTIEHEQEFLEYIADILIILYALDSSLVRA